jgi:hypothetical protein
MPKITVSYRRDDSEAITGRIFDRLVAHYGKSAVFRDIDNIPAGVDFRKHIDEALQETDALIVVIGRRWMGSAKPGNSRIQDEADPVRIEVESALKRGVAVIPVLVGGARMPTAAQLPASLEELAFRNAVRVDTGQDFDHHADRLLRAMDRTLGRDQSDAPVKAPPDAVRALATAEPAAPLREPDVAATGGSEKARPEWGGYAKSSVAHMIGSYLVLRAAFKTPRHVVTYATDLFWDDAEGGLMFQERDRLDARHSHRGHVRLPNMSMYMYLVSGENGWLRSVTLSVLDVSNEFHGILTTLHNIAGMMFVPVATPVVYWRRESFDGDRFGEITPGDPNYETYLEALKESIANTYVKMVVPGVP